MGIKKIVTQNSWNQGNDPPPEKLWIGGQILHVNTIVNV